MVQRGIPLADESKGYRRNFVKRVLNIIDLKIAELEMLSAHLGRSTGIQEGESKEGRKKERERGALLSYQKQSRAKESKSVCRNFQPRPLRPPERTPRCLCESDSEARCEL